MIKSVIAPVFVGCGILLLSPHIWVHIGQFGFVLSMVLFLSALVYVGFYIDNLWGKKEYRLIKQSLCLMTVAIVVCSVIVVVSMKLFPIKFMAFSLLCLNPHCFDVFNLNSAK